MADTTESGGEFAINANVDLNTVLAEAPAEIKEMVALSMALSACMAAQNEVTARQEKSLVDLALLVNQAIQLKSSESSTGGSFPGDESTEDLLSPLLDKLKTSCDQYQEAAAATQSVLNNHNTAPRGAGGAASNQIDPGDYRASSLRSVYEAVAEALNLTAQNAAATQQALNELATPVVASAINLILSTAQGERTAEDKNPDKVY